MNTTDRMLKYINGYKLSSALFVAAELKLFDFIDGAVSTEEIALAVNIDAKALEILLNLFCSFNILQKKDEVYFLDEELKPLLNSSSATSMIPLMQLEGYLSQKHLGKEKLKTVLLTGTGSDELNNNQKENHEIIYGKAMEAGGQYSSLCTARELSRIKKGRVLDVGGGIGSHAIKLCQMNHDIEVDIIDKAEMKKECCQNISKNGFESRIKFMTGDLRYFDYNGRYEGILVSNVLHLFSQDTNIMLLRKCANLLTEEGILVLHDFFLEEKKEQHQISALYTLDWLMQGSLFNASVQEIENWLTKAGLRLHREVRYSSIPTSIIIAKKAV